MQASNERNIENAGRSRRWKIGSTWQRKPRPCSTPKGDYKHPRDKVSPLMDEANKRERMNASNAQGKLSSMNEGAPEGEERPKFHGKFNLNGMDIPGDSDRSGRHVLKAKRAAVCESIVVPGADELSLGDEIDIGQSRLKSTQVDVNGDLDEEKLNQADPFEALLNESKSCTEDNSMKQDKGNKEDVVATEQLIDVTDGSLLVEEQSQSMKESESSNRKSRDDAQYSQHEGRDSNLVNDPIVQVLKMTLDNMEHYVKNELSEKIATKVTTKVTLNLKQELFTQLKTQMNELFQLTELNRDKSLNNVMEVVHEQEQ